MTLERKHMAFAAEIKADGDDGKIGKIKGYGSVFGIVDSYGESVEKGAFDRSLKTYGLPALLYQHNSYDVIGVWTKAYEDDHGLVLEGEINLDVQKGKEAYSLAKQGALKGLSIGFYTRQSEYDKDGVRHLMDVELLEVSMVTFPANREANITGVKAAHKSEREFEEFLRDAGYSRTQAKTIVSKGYKAISDLRDAEDDDGVVSELKNTLNILKEYRNDGRSEGSGKAGQ